MSKFGWVVSTKGWCAFWLIVGIITTLLVCCGNAPRHYVVESVDYWESDDGDAFYFSKERWELIDVGETYWFIRKGVLSEEEPES